MEETVSREAHRLLMELRGSSYHVPIYNSEIEYFEEIND